MRTFKELTQSQRDTIEALEAEGNGWLRPVIPFAVGLTVDGFRYSLALEANRSEGVAVIAVPDEDGRAQIGPDGGVIRREVKGEIEYYAYVEC